MAKSTDVWEKVKDYLTKAGTTIFIASILLWFLLNYGPGGMVDDIAASLGAGIGRFLVPFLAPASHLEHKHRRCPGQKHLERDHLKRPAPGAGDNYKLLSQQNMLRQELFSRKQ